MDACGTVNRDDRKKYKVLKRVLGEKFGSQIDARRAQAELRRIHQAPGEDIESFSGRVREFTKKANPTLSFEQLDHTALDHFLCGLCDPQLQEKLHNDDRAQSLTKAEEVARKYKDKDETLNAMRGSAEQEGEAVIAAKTRQAQAKDEKENSELGEIRVMIDELRKEVDKIANQQHRSGNSAGIQGRCYQCGNTGHFKRNCPQLSHRPPQGQTKPKPVSELHQSKIQCLGCGRLGHELAKCWRTPVAAGGLGSSSTLRSTADSQCLSCGKQGHWAADCRRVSYPQSRNTNPGNDH